MTRRVHGCGHDTMQPTRLGPCRRTINHASERGDLLQLRSSCEKHSKVHSGMLGPPFSHSRYQARANIFGYSATYIYIYIYTYPDPSAHADTSRTCSWLSNFVCHACLLPFTTCACLHFLQPPYRATPTNFSAIVLRCVSSDVVYFRMEPTLVCADSNRCKL